MPVFVNEQGRELGAAPGSALEETLQRKPGWRQVGADEPVADTDDPASAQSDEDLVVLKRDELDLLALEAGVEDPEALPNKGAVIDAIRAARADEED
ncbi:MAG: hypothetical protein M0P31_15445 [Solirubrobacteraceae bacterium]|nr:hypothetical protein [Solirubrobacteraceae bacterium]